MASRAPQTGCRPTHCMPVSVSRSVPSDSDPIRIHSYEEWQHAGARHCSYVQLCKEADGQRMQAVKGSRLCEFGRGFFICPNLRPCLVSAPLPTREPKRLSEDSDRSMITSGRPLNQEAGTLLLVEPNFQRQATWYLVLQSAGHIVIACNFVSA